MEGKPYQGPTRMCGASLHPPTLYHDVSPIPKMSRVTPRSDLEKPLPTLFHNFGGSLSHFPNQRQTMAGDILGANFHP